MYSTVLSKVKRRKDKAFLGHVDAFWQSCYSVWRRVLMVNYKILKSLDDSIQFLGEKKNHIRNLFSGMSSCQRRIQGRGSNGTKEETIPLSEYLFFR